MTLLVSVDLVCVRPAPCLLGQDMREYHVVLVEDRKRTASDASEMAVADDIEHAGVAAGYDPVFADNAAAVQEHGCSVHDVIAGNMR